MGTNVREQARDVLNRQNVMSDLNDYQLDRGQTPYEGPPRRTGLTTWLVVAVVVTAVGGGAYYLFYRKAAPAQEQARLHTEQAVSPATPSAAVAEPGEAIDLPPLDQSDAIVRQLVGRLSAHPRIAAWLATDHLIRNFTGVTLNIANGRPPSRQLARLGPVEKFQVISNGSNTVIDPRSYRRYDSYADAVAELDAQGTARLYATLKPRIQDAYRELGYPEGDFDRVLERAIAELLATPVIDGSIPLASKSVAYEFADPRLQALSPSQRQLLRMGPRNVRLIQGKLREVAPLMGIRVEPQD